MSLNCRYEAACSWANWHRKWVVLCLAVQPLRTLSWRIGKHQQHSAPPQPVKKRAGKPLYCELDEFLWRQHGVICIYSQSATIQVE